MLLVVLLSPHILSRSCLSSLWSEVVFFWRALWTSTWPKQMWRTRKVGKRWPPWRRRPACEPVTNDSRRMAMASELVTFCFSLRYPHHMSWYRCRSRRVFPGLSRLLLKKGAFLIGHKTSQEFLWWNPSCAGHWRQVFGCGYGPPGPATQHQQSMFQNPSQPTHRRSYT